MSLRRILALGVIALAVTACDDDDPTAFSQGPRAFVRVINIMPDSGAIDFRYIDQVENTTGYGLAFGRASQYDNVAAGTRQIRVFRTSTNQAIATQVVVEGQQTFEAGKFYTILLGGRREGNAGTMTLVNDDTTAIAARAANKFALRAYNVSGSAKDVYYRYGASTVALPGTALATNLANGAASPWVSIDTASAIRLSVHTPGVTATALTDAQITVGAPGTTTINPVAGTRGVGSALTAVILPPANTGTAGTGANPTILFVVDRAGTLTAP
jgi:hypothetical protein